MNGPNAADGGYSDVRTWAPLCGATRLGGNDQRPMLTKP